ncbi:MAG: hypothetical protein MRQ09_01930 [Candidatus Midichloria sp.]|nr:hypothetical protein [Candidatus Midichloria sp.]
MRKLDSQIKTIEEHPRQYYYTEKPTKWRRLKTRQSLLPICMNVTCYAKLSEFLWAEYSLYVSISTKSALFNKRGPNGNKWLYPDLVAMQDLTSNWDQTTKNCVQQYSDKKAKLWSFEVKSLINRSNVRKSFFQAVSNSS